MHRLFQVVSSSFVRRSRAFSSFLAPSSWHPSPPIDDFPFNFENFEFSPYLTNTFLLYDDDLKETVLIDCPYDSYASLRSHPAIISSDKVHLFLTHGHVDHAGDLTVFQDELNPPENLVVYAHRHELPIIDESVKVFSNLDFTIDVFVNDGNVFSFFSDDDDDDSGDPGIEFEVLHTPGHSPGSISLYVPSCGIVFVGDTLFQGSIGRTDLPGGFFQTLDQSIREKLYVLPDETVVYCGHGPFTTIGREKFSNYFVRVEDEKGEES